MGIVVALAALLSTLVWAVLLAGRGGFWRFADRDTGDLPEPRHWPSVVAVIPARNEADVIARTIAGVLAQDYPGALRVILVDDQSDDGTAEIARTAAGGDERLRILTGSPRPPGWTGKLWAVEQGIAAAGTPDFLWLTDADIGHTPDNLRRLVARATGRQLAMVTLMAKLHCTTPAERALIPAFVYFFAMLYPFARVNDPRDRMAAAAGGCVLVRREVLAAAGGIASIHAEIIDDCALGRRIKPLGPIWLGLTDRATSLRPYGFADIRKMVARSAYAQLGYAPLALVGTVVGMLVIYGAPPLLAIFGHGAEQGAALSTWAIMSLTMMPILQFYGVATLWGFALPLVALVYTGFTLDSAVQHWRGRGGMWKGRAQALGTGA